MVKDFEQQPFENDGGDKTAAAPLDRFRRSLWQGVRPVGRIGLLVLVVLLAFFAPRTSAQTLQFMAQDLTDTTPGEDLWRYSYSLSGFNFQAGEGFSIFFDHTLFRDLHDVAPASSSFWDVIAVQPDVGLQDPGFLDGLALTSSPPLTQTFEVSFVWLGVGQPGAQPFYTYDEAFAPVFSGVSLVPEPSFPLLFGFGLLAFGLARLSKRRRMPRGIARLACCGLVVVVSGLVVGEGSAQDFTFGNYQTISSSRVGRTEFEFELKVTITNNLASAQGLSAEVFSLSPDTEVLEGTVIFGDVPAGGSAVSLDTFRIRQNRLVSFDPSQLLWFPAAQSMSLMVNITSPSGGLLTNGTNVTVSGWVGPGVTGVRVGGSLGGGDASLVGSNFTASVAIEEGRNPITVLATNDYGGLGSATVIVNRDTTAPLLNIESPADGATVSTRQISVRGMINDAVPGTVNPEQVTVMVNGVEAIVLNRSYSLDDVLLTPGRNVIQVRGRDRAGNEATREVSVTFQDLLSQRRLNLLGGNNQTGLIGETLPDPLVVELVDGNGVPQTNQTVTFTVSRNDGQVSAPPDVGRSLTVSTDDKGLAGVFLKLGSRVGTGNNEVQVTSAGVGVPVIFNANAQGSPPANIVPLIPETQVGEVGRPLPLPWTAFVTDSGGNPVEGALVTFAVTLGDGTLHGATLVSTNTDADGRATVIQTLGSEEGVNNNAVTATVSGVTNAAATFTASALAAGQLSQTRVSGLVLDNANRPMSNILCRIDNTFLVTVTDAQGQFTLSNAPVGSIRLTVDGRNRGYGGSWHTLQFDLVTVAGRENRLDRPIYLLPLDEAHSAIAGGDQDVTLQLDGIPGSSMTIYAHSLRDQTGQPITNRVMWTQVNLERVPMAPPLGSQFTVVWTVQPINLRFNPPARVCLPNNGAPPGQVMELFGFDHDLNAFVSIGTGTVSPDGSQICSDPGFGITKSGWGGAVPPPPPKDCVGTPPPCKKCNKDTGTFVADPAKNGSGCDSDGDGVDDGVCENGVCKPVTEYDPGEALTDDASKGGTSIPWEKNNIQASAGEKMIWNLEAVDKDRKRRKGTAAWTEIDPGPGPYEITVTISGQADWDSQSSGTTVKTYNSLYTGNIILWTRTNWDGSTITVTAVYKDKATPPPAPDIGTTKDGDHTTTWTVIKRTNCPTTQVTMNPGEAWCPAQAGVWGPYGSINDSASYKQCYSYQMGPDIDSPGQPDYLNQTILESFQNVTAYNFTMAEVTDQFKTNNPALNTADKIAVFLWNSSNNGTFVINNNDRIYDGHSGFGSIVVGGVQVFTAAAQAAGLGYVLPQTYTCGPTVTANYTITREYKNGNVRIKKDGP